MTVNRPHAPSRREEERAIVEAVLQGDYVEFEVLVRRYQRPIYHLMLRATRQDMVAEDLTQDAFTRAYAKLHTYKLRKRFFPWLYAIAINICKDYFRRLGLNQDLFAENYEDANWPDPNGSDCSRKPDCVLEVGQITEKLEAMPLRYSEPMLLYYREGFSIREISSVLGVSSAAIKVRIHRGRQKLKERLGVSHEKTK